MNKNGATFWICQYNGAITLYIQTPYVPVLILSDVNPTQVSLLSNISSGVSSCLIAITAPLEKQPTKLENAFKG